MENFRKKTTSSLRDHKIEKLHEDKVTSFDDKFKKFFNASVAAYENSMFKAISDIDIEKVLDTLKNHFKKNDNFKIFIKYEN